MYSASQVSKTGYYYGVSRSVSPPVSVPKIYLTASLRKGKMLKENLMFGSVVAMQGMNANIVLYITAENNTLIYIYINKWKSLNK